MKYLSILIIVFSFVLLTAQQTADYSWEDGIGTALGTYGNAVLENSNEQTHSGSYALKYSEDPLDGTPQAYIWWITGLTDGDVIDASFWVYDINAQGDYPKGRIWGHFTETGGDVTSYSSSAGGNDAYSTEGWSYLEWSWTFDSAAGTQDGFVVEARIYSQDPPNNLIYIDDTSVTVSSNTAVIHSPAPATEPTIIVNSPNGGEVWEQGSVHEITWTSLNFSDNVKIEAELIDRTREVLIASTENDGIWEWDIPAAQPVDDWYVIIISDAADFDPWDQSDNPFSIIEPITTEEVSTIAELRIGALESTIYQLTGEAILTFQQDFRNQKYIQDATAAILIDDDTGVIETGYQLGDGITNLTGTLIEYAGMLQFVPTEDAGVINSNGNEITPEIITIAQFNSSFEEYESELIQFEDVVFSDQGNFANGTVYEISDDSRASCNFRTTFYDVDYIGQSIPVIPTNVTGICNSREDGNFITSRSASDLIPATTEEFITVLTPNGGEAWYQNQNYDITWSSTNYTGNVKIELLLDLTVVQILDEETDNDGVWEWLISDAIETGNTYQIRISDPVDADPTDDSDEYFNILAEAVSPDEGDIIINEIMQNPAAAVDGEGEWFEIYNTTNATIDLIGWVISDADTDEHIITGTLTIDPASYLVLGINDNEETNGGVQVDYMYEGITLANGEDEIILSWIDGTTVIDMVAYDNGLTFPDPNGASMELDPQHMDYVGNDNGANWHEAVDVYGAGDLGTPGEPNSEPINADDNVVQNIQLLENYPNPFNPTTVISFTLNADITERTELTIFNLKGQRVKNYSLSNIQYSFSNDQYSVTWDGKDDNGNSVPSGVYLYKLRSGDREQTRKMALIK